MTETAHQLIKRLSEEWSHYFACLLLFYLFFRLVLHSSVLLCALEFFRFVQFVRDQG